MQVGDSSAPPHLAAAIRKDEPRSDEGCPRRDRRGRPDFGAVLQSPLSGHAAGLGPEAATAATMSGWFRADAPPPAPPTAAGVPPVRQVERVLIGACGETAEARIRIGGGVLAGTEIRLHAGPGGSVVEAQLLTRVDGSRQTLSVVMDEIAVRLRDKGIALQVRRGDVAREGNDHGERRREGGAPR